VDVGRLPVFVLQNVTERAVKPAALLPPPTQAITTSGSFPSTSRHCARASSPMMRWKSRTIMGNGCGPTTDPMM
jgi:hypothetical protein